MDKDTQLPAEVTDEIWEKAKAYAKSHGRKEIGYYSLNWQAGATEYAIKLHQCDKANKALEETNRGLIEEIEQAKQAFKVCDESGRRVAEEYDRLSKRYNGAYDLLEKFISRHEAGLLPDMFLYNDIKTFLDGKK